MSVKIGQSNCQKRSYRNPVTRESADFEITFGYLYSEEKFYFLFTWLRFPEIWFKIS